jgi:hypothetical protein
MSRFGGAWDRDPINGKHGCCYSSIYKKLVEEGAWNESSFKGETDIRKVIAEKKRWKSVIGYYIWDEPFFEEQFSLCRKLTDDCEDEDSSALAFTVANPSYNPYFHWDGNAYPEYVERFADSIDPPILSFDYYPIGRPEQNEEHQLDNSPMWCDLAAVSRIAQERKIPFWFYYQGIPLYACTDYFIFPMVRCFMYAGILYGAKALQHYAAGEGNNCLIKKNGDKDVFFDDMKQIHSEIKALGNTLMALDSKKIYHSAELLPGCEYIKPYVDNFADSDIFAGELSYRTSVGELADAYGNNYVVILNRDYENTLDASLALKNASRIYEVSKVDGTQQVIHENTTTLPLHLEPGDAVLLRIQNADEEAFTIDYQLVEE